MFIDRLINELTNYLSSNKEVALTLCVAVTGRLKFSCSEHIAGREWWEEK